MKKHSRKNESAETMVGTKTCFVCKTIAPREEMLRFVGRQGQTVQFDAQERLPGRGMWLHANKECLRKAIEKHLFYKAAKGTVNIPEDLMNTVENELKNCPQKQKLFFKGAIYE